MQLTDQPKVVKQNKDGSSYIPIGEVEETLDQLYPERWGTENFRFHIFQVFDKWFASGTATLVLTSESGFTTKMEGSGTIQMYSNDLNTHYEATVLSYCISNAAGRKGKVLGRALNGRLENGETSLPVIQVNESQSNEIDSEFEKAKTEATKAKTRDAARAAIKKYGFSDLNPTLKNIIESKKS